MRQYPELTKEQAMAIIMLEAFPEWNMLIKIQQEYIQSQKFRQCSFDHKTLRGEIDEGIGIIKGMERISLQGIIELAKTILRKTV